MKMDEKRDDEIILIPMTRKQVEVVQGQFIEDAIREWDDANVPMIFDSNKNDKVEWLNKLSKTLDDCLEGEEGLSRYGIFTLMVAIGDSIADPLTQHDPKLKGEMFALLKKLKGWIE